MLHTNLTPTKKRRFSVFWAILCGNSFKVCKKWLKVLMRSQENYFWKNQIRYQKTLNFMLITERLKKLQKMHTQKVSRKSIWWTWVKVEKEHFSTTFLSITFCAWIFLQLFQQFWSQHKILRCLYLFLFFSKILKLSTAWTSRYFSCLRSIYTLQTIVAVHMPRNISVMYRVYKKY